MNQFHVSDKLREASIYWSEACIVVDGCTKVSEGCLNCWAESMYKQYHPRGDFSKITVHLDRFERKAKIKKPQVFSLWNDIYHPEITGQQQQAILELIERNRQHTFLALTKRPEFIRPFDPLPSQSAYPDQPPNLWIGTMAENKECADKRIPELLKCGSRNLFLSLEPLLGPIDIDFDSFWTNDVNANVISWVIVGCETGPKAKRRPCDPEWIRSIVRQCYVAEVACWVKAINVGGKVIRHWKDWPAEYEDLKVREFPR